MRKKKESRKYGKIESIEALQMLFEKNIVMGTHTLDDVQETVNSFYTFDLVIECLGKKITVEMIKEWHSSLMYRTRLYDMGLAGVFKKYPNKILGADFDTASPWETEEKVNSIINSFNNLKIITLETIAKFYVEFEKIHPFQDGNGRIGRFIFLKQLLDNRLPLQYMNGDTSDDYKKSLAKCTKDDVNSLIDYIKQQRDFIEDNKNMF